MKVWKLIESLSFVHNRQFCSDKSFAACGNFQVHAMKMDLLHDMKQASVGSNYWFDERKNLNLTKKIAELRTLWLMIEQCLLYSSIDRDCFQWPKQVQVPLKLSVRMKQKLFLLEQNLWLCQSFHKDDQIAMTKSTQNLSSIRSFTVLFDAFDCSICLVVSSNCKFFSFLAKQISELRGTVRSWKKLRNTTEPAKTVAFVSVDVWVEKIKTYERVAVLVSEWRSKVHKTFSISAMQ